jgi:hypothetical protein
LNRASRSAARTDEERSPLAQVQALAPEEVVIEATGLRMSYDGAWRGRVGVNGVGMTVTFADRPDGGTRVQISGAVSGGCLELASDPEAWSEALGVTPPA